MFLKINSTNSGLSFQALGQIHISKATLKFFRIPKMIEADTKSNQNINRKKSIFAMAHLQNYKRVKIRMDDLIYLSNFLGPKILIRLQYMQNIKTPDSWFLLEVSASS